GVNLEYLTVKEVAELKGCTVRYVRSCIIEGKLSAVSEICCDNNRLQYKIPLSALPDELKSRYYSNIRTAENAPPEKKDKPLPKDKKQCENSVKRSFEEYSEEERREILFWQNIIEQWQAMRAEYRKKTEFDPMFCAKVKLEHPDINVSPDILYRKYAAYKKQDMDGLIDKRGGWNKGRFAVNEQIWKAFLWFYLDEKKPTVSDCYKSVCDWTTEFHPELLEIMPSERSFRRHIESDVKLYVKTYKRSGQKALLDRCSPYTERMYDGICANDVWVADNHTLDVISTDGQVKHRLYLTAFQDIKSGVIVGFNITENPSSQSTLIALRMGIMRFGIPKLVYLDNGSEFANYDVAGRGYRSTKKAKTEPLPANIFQRLGIKAQFAQVCNADAKPIERTFLTVKNQFSRELETFCGGNICERSESLKRIIKDGKKIPTDSVVREYIRIWIDGDYNLQEYGGSEQRYKGMRRIDVWNESIKSAGVRMAEESELNLMMMRASRFQKVKRNGVYLNISGEKIWYYDIDTCNHIGETVCVRYDPADLRQVRIYDTEDRYMFTWQLNDVMLCDYIAENKDEVRDAEEMKRRVVKYMKQSSEELLNGLPEEQRITAIDLKIRKAYERSAEFKIELPNKIIPVKISEPEAVPAAANDDTMAVTIDYSRINRNLRNRKDNYNDGI
ncbi:MAG: Mu transposase C-terminal domain-containing protein, partial [Ruminococcus sp.]|nr:Mu transposase C-terminal domain-containing protein [Ruminococcus sp.]